MSENELEKSYRKLDNSIKDIINRIYELESQRTADSVWGKIDYAFNEIDVLTTKIDKIMQKINTINFDDKYIEVFSDEDLKSYYAQSGFSLPQIKEFVEKYITKEPIDERTAYRYANGEMKDLRCRSKIGKFLREAALIATKV